jgi:hypothetical protein
MIRTFTILTLLFINSIFCLAQISIEPGSLEVVFNETKNHAYNLVITNKSTKEVSLWWEVIKGANFPAAWKTVMCDNELCYDANADKADPRRGNKIEAGKSLTFKLDLFSENTKGNTTMQVKLFDDKDFKNVVAQTKASATVVADIALSSNQNSIDDLIIYPNPSDHFFFIKSDQNVNRVVFYNIMSKEIRSEQHSKGQSHDISDMNKGIYFVKLMDNKGKTLKSLRLNKR